MHQLVKIILTVLDLFECEVAALRRGTLHLAIAVALVVVSLGFLWSGFGLMVWGLYVALQPHAGVAGSAAVAGATALILAGILILIAKRIVR
jgi:hypothetical protein